MSEAWRELARLGKTGEKYPHILVDSHGWCLRLGARDREDDKYFSSLGSLLQGLSEHLLRRKDQKNLKTILEMKEFLLQNLSDARELGEELERSFPDLRQRLVEGRERVRIRQEPETPRTRSQIVAGTVDVEPEAA